MDTTVTQIQEDLDVVQQLMSAATDAAEPMPADVKQELEKIGKQAASIASVTSAGYVTLYRVKTGESVLCNRNLLATMLRKKDEVGKRVFDTRDPGIRPQAGTYKCLLHSDHPMRPDYDRMGLPSCRKATLASEFQVEQHMRVVHGAEWRILEAIKQKAEKDDERAFQKALLERLSAPPARKPEEALPPLAVVADSPQETPPAVGTPDTPLYVSPKPKKAK